MHIKTNADKEPHLSLSLLAVVCGCILLALLPLTVVYNTLLVVFVVRQKTSIAKVEGNGSVL